MPLLSLLASCLRSSVVAGCVLSAATVHAAARVPSAVAAHASVLASDAPLRVPVSRESPRGARLRADAPDTPGFVPRDARGSSGPPLPTVLPNEHAPLSAGTYVAHGGLSLLPLATPWVATHVGGDTRLGATASESAAGLLLGALPGQLLFIRPTSPEGRWTELEVVAFGAGVVLTPPAAALGTWGFGELAYGDSRHPGDAYLGALGGAAVGTLLGVVVHAVLDRLAQPSTRLSTVRELIALGLIGSASTVGYQWAGGGPRDATR